MPRTLLLVLVLIALLCAMALGAGAYLGDSPPDRDPPDMRGSRLLSWIDRVGLRSPVDSFTVTGGCRRDGASIDIGGGAVCLLHVPVTPKRGVRSGTLSPGLGEIHLCLALNDEQLKDTCDDATVRGEKYKSDRPTRLTVPQKGAWVKVWCGQPATAECRVSVR